MTYINDKAIAEIPEIMIDWNSDQIDAAVVNEIEKMVPYSHTPIHEVLQTVFNAICDPDNWKNAVYVRDSQIAAPWIEQALIHFHGCKPQKLNDRGFYSPGYAC